MMRSLLIGTVAALFLAGCSAPEATTPAEPETATDAVEAVSPEEANLATVKQIYAYFEAGDVPSFLGLLDPEIVWNEAENFPYAVTNPHVGPDAVVAGVFGPMATDWTSFAVAPESYMADGDRVAMFGRYEAVSSATGRSMNPQVVHVWTLKDGKAVAFQQYADTLATQEALTPDASE